MIRDGTRDATPWEKPSERIKQNNESNKVGQTCGTNYFMFRMQIHCRESKSSLKKPLKKLILRQSIKLSLEPFLWYWNQFWRLLILDKIQVDKLMGNTITKGWFLSEWMLKISAKRVTVFPRYQMWREVLLGNNPKSSRRDNLGWWNSSHRQQKISVLPLSPQCIQSKEHI